MKCKDILEKEIGKILIKKIQEKSGENSAEIIKSINFNITIPELQFGDFTTNVAMVASKILNQNSLEIAKEIKLELEKRLCNNFIEKIDIAGPGFLNIWLKKEFLQKELIQQNKKIEKDEFFLENNWTNKKIIIEHTSVNLFKPFTIGHLMSNFIGTFILNIAKISKAKTINLSYPSDKSIGIAKAIWIIKQDGGIDQQIFKTNENEIIKYLGDCYRRGVAEFKTWEEDKECLMAHSLVKIQEVKNIANNIFNNIKSEDLDIYEYAKKINLNYFENILKRVNSHFDEFIFESEAGIVGKEVVKNLVEENLVFQKSEGAIVYIPAENRKDISTSVFINSEDNPTYLAKDIGLLKIKFEKFNPDYSLYVVDNEQIPHFKSVFSAAESIDGDFTKYAHKSIHIPHGRMTFKGKKMSSRLGGVPTGEEVLNTVIEEVKERSDEKLKDLNEVMKEKVQTEIALSALRVSILRSKLGGNIDFDPERTLSFEGDSGPYLCYTFARCCSLLEKSKITFPDLNNFSDFEKEKNISDLERKIFQYKNIIENVARDISPQILMTYLFELAALFNQFYANNKIIIEDDLISTSHNLYIVDLVKSCLGHGLSILGINAPEKM